jgi:hypothetical protein
MHVCHYSKCTSGLGSSWMALVLQQALLDLVWNTTICGKGYADSPLGWTRGNLGALHAQREHCEHCNVCRSPKESSVSCHQVHTTRTSEYRRFVATWQCLAPYCPFNCCNNPRYVLQVSSISAVLAPSDFHVFGPLKEAMGGKSFRSDEEVQLAVHEWLCSQPKDFFSRGIHALPKCWNTCMVRNGDYIEKWSRSVPFEFNKLQDKKYLRLSFDSPMYIIITKHNYIQHCRNKC